MHRLTARLTARRVALVVLSFAFGFAWVAALAGQAAAAERPLRILFLGDEGHHRPAERFRQLHPEMARRGIELIYTDRLDDLNLDRLSDFDGLAIYANQTEITPAQEQALLEYVAQGHGFIPLHCASYCFLNSEKYIALVGAQFQRHETGVFRVEQEPVAHPILEGFGSFESWDETYVHHKHNEQDRIVLERRREESTADAEPWTWVRTHGAGRVFYTAWGHDDRTWGHPGFHNLVERGIRWACGGDPSAAGPYQDRPEMTTPSVAAAPFEYMPAELPFYPAGKQWGTIGEPISQMQKPLTPEESIKHFSVPRGFEPQLVAAEPEIGKPIAMNWDERGRLWLCETYDYPNEMQPPGQGRDRIRICEDTDNDGRADKFTVFAEKLSIPTSLAFAYGGVIVHQAPDTLFLRDNDGDDVADQRDVLFTGWATDDTHAGPSNLNYGLDGWYYGITGYAGFNGEIAGQPERFRTGFYRFKLANDPDEGHLPPEQRRPFVSQFEFLRNTNNNSWGVGISEDGVLFGSTANGNPSEYMPIANRYYERVRGWSSSVLEGMALDNAYDPITEAVRQVDWHGGFTAGAGHALYTARVYPREYWNRTAFVAEPTGHLVATFTIQPSGAGFRSRNSWNLIASKDEWTAPIMAEVGPDGNVWIIDWYNIIVQHNPTPVGYETGKGNAYVTDLRDRTHGRVYRLAFPAGKNGPPGAAAERVAPPQLAGATSEQLVAALAHTNFFWRRHAQRMLVERGEAHVLPLLDEVIASARPDDGENFVPAAAHALWAQHEIRDAQPDGAERISSTHAAALRSPFAGVRRNAVLTLPRTTAAADSLATAGLMADPDGQVRLASLLVLADCPPSSSAAALVAQALYDPVVLSDRWLLDAVTCAAAVQADSLIEQLADQELPAPPAPALERLRIVGEHVARGGETRTLPDLLTRLARTKPATAAAIIAGLAEGWPRGRPAPLGPAETALSTLFESAGPATRSQLLSLASRLGSQSLEKYSAELSASLLATIQDADGDPSTRLAAAQQLIELRMSDASAAADLLDLIDPRTDPEIGEGLLTAVASSDAPEVYADLSSRLSSYTPAIRAAAIRTLLSKTEGARALLAAIDAGGLRFDDLSLDQKQGLAAHPDSDLAAHARELLARGGGLPNPDRQKVIDEFLAVTHETGAPGAGKEVFKKQCSKCHIHSGEGTRIGPDLTGMAVHPKHELLIHVLDPSRSVEGNYRSYTVATVDGRVLTGLLASETKTSIELFDSEGKKQSLPREDVDELVASTKSLMPEGFEKQISRTELTDLLEFLTQRGKYLPVPLDKAATVVSTRGMFIREEANVERLIFPDWTTKTFKGVPFMLIDPQGDRINNAVLLHSPNGAVTQRMPHSVKAPCNAAAAKIHLLSGVSGWGHPFGEDNTVTMIVRLHYADGASEDHELLNGVHFADYIRRVDVPGSEFAFPLRGQQIRYLEIAPQRSEVIREIEFVKGPDACAPVVFAATIETR